MTTQKKHGFIYSIWKVIISIRLTIALLLVLSAVCIIGTVVPQNESKTNYQKIYSESTYNLLESTGCTDLYHAWWFITLMGIFSLNLTACTLHRIPRTKKLISMSDTLISEERAKDLLCCKKFTFKELSSKKEGLFSETLEKHLNKPVITRKDNKLSLFSEKGRFSPLAFYLTHAGILIIIIGVLIGTFGYKGYMQIFEGETKNEVIIRDSRNSEKLPFEIRCDKFDLTYYDDAKGYERMPKDYKSTLTVLEDGKEIFTKEIEVNDPLIYKGIFFYQSSYGQGNSSSSDVLLSIHPLDKPGEVQYRVSIGETFTLKGTKDKVKVDRLIPDFGINDKGNYFSRSNQLNNPAVLLTFFRENMDPYQVWTFAKHPNAHKKENQIYDVHFVNIFPTYYTGLQVAKDPGVITVWVGCLLMTIGIYLAFFSSHRRIWLIFTINEDSIQAVVAGTCTKNRETFTEAFNDLFNNLKTKGNLKC